MPSNNVLMLTNLSTDSTDIDRQLSKNIAPSSNLVFIDSNISDYASLAAGVIPGAKVIILKPDCDGIKQITEALNSYSYSYPVSLHIVSHGSPGCLYLGDTQLSLDTLNKYTQDLKTWFSQSPQSSPSPLSPPSLLIYGCNVAAGDAGAEFIAKLNAITGAEIAASTTRIGNAAKGGNWELDYQTTLLLETTPLTKGCRGGLAFTAEAKANYQGVLVTLFNDNFENGNLKGWIFDPNGAVQLHQHN